jgi:hypothetical protein
MYLQFPWRFLSISTLFISLGAGGIALLKPKYTILFILLALLSNAQFFRPDIWKNESDKSLFSGKFWDEQRYASNVDYWPVKSNNPPNSLAPVTPQADSGAIFVKKYTSRSSKSDATISVMSKLAQVSFPVVNFPGWRVYEKGKVLRIIDVPPIYPITVELPAGEHYLQLRFENTFPRILGNTISLASLIILSVVYRRYRKG